MDYFCGPLTLYTCDKIRLIDFLSDVFEFEVDTELDIVTGGSLNLKIEEISKNALSDASHLGTFANGVAFSFELKNEEELSEIVKKYNFFQYRNHEHNAKSEKLSVSKKSELTIFDLDGREWRFKARINH